MKKYISAIAIVLAVALVAVAFASCRSKPDVTPDNGVTESGSTAPQSTTDKVYKIVADNSFAPFEYLDADSNTYVGVDMDILAAIAADQGFKYDIDNCGWDAALASLSASQCDGMIAGMTITEERQKTFDFSAPYFEDGQTLFVAKDSSIATLEDLQGKKVAVKTGTMGAEYCESIKDQYGFEIESFKGSDEVYAAVSTGNVDAGVEDFSVINFKISDVGLGFKLLGEKVNVKPYGFATPKGANPELIEMFNKGLENIKANGTYAEILAKYGM